MPRFLVTGASGLLGLNFSLRAAMRNEVIGIYNHRAISSAPFQVKQLDFFEEDIFLDAFEKIKPDVILHCAAMANLEECEKFPEEAKYLNTEIPGKIAYFCKKNQIKMVHVSTDAVFNGEIGNYSEFDKPEPLSTYAKTKKDSEDFVLKENPEALITRVNFFGWSLDGNRSLGEFFYNNLKSQTPINGFTDVKFCPLYVSLLSDLLMEMVTHKLSGLYHVVSSDHMSKYEFGCAIADQFGFNSSIINPISVNQSNLVAERSKNLTLSTEKLSYDLRKKIPTIRQGIKSFYSDHKNGLPEKLRSFTLERN